MVLERIKIEGSHLGTTTLSWKLGPHSSQGFPSKMRVVLTGTCHRSISSYWHHWSICLVNKMVLEGVLDDKLAFWIHSF